MSPTDDDFKRADWLLLKNGAVTLFHKIDVWRDQIVSLSALGYRIIEIVYSGFDQFVLEVSAALRWKDQFGYEPWTGNLDALNDAFRDPPFEEGKHLALAISNFDALVRDEAATAEAFMDFLERQSRQELLRGRCLVGLLQTNDADYASPTIGGVAPRLNWNEWLARAFRKSGRSIRLQK